MNGLNKIDAELLEEEAETGHSDDRPVAVMMPVQPKPQKKARRAAFTAQGKTNIDSVEITTEHGTEEIVIPAIHRTIYWAGLKFMYMNHSRKVYCPELCNGVEALLRDADPRKWDRFHNKANIKTCYGREVSGRTVVEQAADPYDKRMVTNLRNLCRLGGANDYGSRLIERGHVLRYETEPDGRGYFFLHLKLTAENTAPRKRGRKPRLPEAAAVQQVA